RNAARAPLTRLTSKEALTKLSQGGLKSRNRRKYAVAAKRKVPIARPKPTSDSLASRDLGNARLSITGMARISTAKPRRILAINTSPERPATANTGSGRDQNIVRIFFTFMASIDGSEKHSKARCERQPRNSIYPIGS